MPTVQNRITTGIGLRHVRIAKRDDDGTFEIPTVGDYVPESSGVAYQGIWSEGAIRMTLNLPEPRRITARGDDRGYYTFQLPPEELPTGELAFTKTHMDIISMVTDTLVFGSPTVRKIGLATNKLGYEPACFLRGSRQAVDTQDGSEFFGNQVWQTYMVLNALLSHRPISFEDGAIGEFVYPITANDSTTDEIGTTFTTLVHGFTKAPYLLMVSEGKVGLDAFLGAGAAGDYTLSYAEFVLGTDPIIVTVNGDVVATDETDGVVTVTPTPGATDKVMVEYGYDD